VSRWDRRRQGGPVGVIYGGHERQAGVGHKVADCRRHEQLARRRPFGEAHGGLDTRTVDPVRVREQLAIISGCRLSQFSIAINGIRLAFWGEAAGTVSREIFIEQPTIVLARPGKPTAAHAPDSDAVATALLSVLSQGASEITLTGGQLVISFETGLALKVDPDQRYESWQISSDDGLLIVCMPGGELAIWYPPGSA
jgi:Family of unknown function (DUF6188)